MFCTNCGSNLPDGTKFCTNCGASVEQPAAQAAPAPEATPAPEVAFTAPEVSVVETPVAPVVETPIAPVVETPVAPVVETPVAPVETPVQPVYQQPVQNQYQQPVQPEQPVYQQPVQPQYQQQTQPAPDVYAQAAMASQNAYQQAYQQNAYQQVPVQNPAPSAKPKKKGKVGLIIGIIAAVLVVAIGAVAAISFMNSPSQKLKKAIEAKDMNAICDIYGELTKAEDIEKAQSAVLEDLNNAYDAFYNETGSYDEFIKISNLLGTEVLADNDYYQNTVRNAKDIKESRDAYAMAEELFAQEEYEEAYIYYSKVSSDDTKYSDAQNKMVTCEENTNYEDKLIGSWVVSFEASGMMDEEDLGFALTEPLYCDLYFDFYSDYSGFFYLDADKFIAGLIDPMYDALVEMYGEMGYSEAYLDELMIENGFGGLRDYVETLCYSSEFFDASDVSQAFTWELDKDQLIFDGDAEDTNTIEIKNDTLYIQLSDEQYEPFEMMGLTNPLEFTKVY